jgi:creatinine amidohydrolase
VTDESEITDEPYRVAEMTWREIETALERTSTLLVPVGNTEQYGHHLPLGVDVYMPKAIGERVARRSPALLAPPIWYGVSPHIRSSPAPSRSPRRRSSAT